MRTLVRLTAGPSLSGSVAAFVIGCQGPARAPAATGPAGPVRIAVGPGQRPGTGYLPPSRLSTGLPNGNGLPPTDTIAVPRYP